MRKKYYFLFLFILLVGCSERKLEFDRTYPDTARIDAIKAEKQAKQQNNDSEFSFLIDSNIKPEELAVTADTNTEMGFSAWPAIFCWKATYEECEHLKPLDFFSDDRFIPRHFTIKANSLITITYHNLAMINKELPTLDDLEVYILNDDLSLTPYPYKKINEYTWKFTTPPETTVTTKFVFKAIYKTKIGGVTYYPMPITGK